MSIFGQVWLWSLLAFFAGALGAWLVLVLPLRKTVRNLESALSQAHADAAHTPANAAALVSDPPGTPVFNPDYSPEQPVSQLPTAPVRRTSFDEIDADFAEFDSSVQASGAYHPPAVEEEEEYEAEYPTASEPVTAVEPTLAPELDDPYRAAATQYLTPVGTTPEAEDDDPYRTAANEFLRPEEAEPLSPLESRLEPGELFQTPDPAHSADPDWFEEAAPVAERSAFEEPLDRTQIISDYPGKAEDEETATGGILEVPDEPPAPEVPEETPMESTQILPKRQPREAPRGGFEAPRPIQPSMRAVERREPDLTGGHSGSLFEPSVPAGQPAASLAAPEPPPARQTTAEAVPPGPFGPGSAMPRPGGGRPGDGFAVKASVTALRYCTEESAQFPRMVAEVWFRTPEDAERVGFRPLT